MRIVGIILVVAVGMVSDFSWTKMTKPKLVIVSLQLWEDVIYYCPTKIDLREASEKRR